MPANPGKLRKKFDFCLKSERYLDEIANDISDAKSLEIRGSPTFFIAPAAPVGETVKGMVLKGLKPVSEIEKVIHQLLKKRIGGYSG